MKLLNNLIVTTLPLVPKPVVKIIANKYIAGITLGDAVKTVQQLNAKQALCTIDVLGEDIFTKEQAEASREASIRVLNAVHENNLQANLSIKITSLGLKIDKEFCQENVNAILRHAASLNNFVRIDMEDHTCTAETLEVYRTVRNLYPKHVGIVIQAYLYRSKEDILALAQEQANVRLCKGIYNEPAKVAIKDRAAIQKNYNELLQVLLEKKCYTGIATHDDVLIEHAKRLIGEMKLSKNEYEFQMLLGVRNEKRDELLAEKHRLRVYVPFGKDWYGYSVRRLKENPQMAGHVFKAIFGLEK
ncbi:MAG: proline dehydrogenase family protein [Bacteroidetes bacterium]|nr:proline dehydrogenase family protein [Bacteroidota bacterium]